VADFLVINFFWSSRETVQQPKPEIRVAALIRCVMVPRHLQEAHPPYTVGWHGRTLCEESRGAYDGKLITPERLGQEATHRPAD
jgi:hypothetical protein